MILTKHELRQGKLSLLIWTLSIGFLMAVCIFLFPEMKSQMEDVNKIFASMGSFTAAFGMDRLNFGTLIGFYSVECGNILGLGGAFFAALTAASILAKEEKDRTAEFLLTHPVSRFRVVTEKLFAVLIQLIIMNSFILILSLPLRLRFSAGCATVTAWKRMNSSAPAGRPWPWRSQGTAAWWCGPPAACPRPASTTLWPVTPAGSPGTWNSSAAGLPWPPPPPPRRRSAP